MIDAMQSIQGFIEGRERADLDTDQMLLFALVRAVEIIGEAASRISAATREGSSDIPWAAIIAMRNRLIHAYFDIDRDVLWNTVTIGTPRLQQRLEQLLDSDKAG